MKRTEPNQFCAPGIGKGARVPVAFETGEEHGAVPGHFSGTRNGILGLEPRRAPLWDLLGAAVSDASYETSDIVVGDQRFRFKTPKGWEDVPHVGPRFSAEAGGKREAATDLNAVAERIGAKRVNGGGLVNSAKELARLRRVKRMALRLRTIDSSASWLALDAELSAFGIEHVPLGLTPALTNLVVTNGGGPLLRWILKSPMPSPIALNGEWDRAMEQESTKPDVLLINSARPEELVRAGVVSSLRYGTRIYSLATPSIPVDARIKLLLPNSRVTQFSLDEFADLAEALGIECPLEERLTAVPAVGEAIAELVQSLPFPARDLVVTMGEGMVAYDSRKGCICHVGLSREGLTAARSYLPREMVKGIGDRTFAALVLAYETAGVAPESSRIVRAARQAWADVLQGSGPFLQPKPSWFQVTVLACECFGTKWTQLPLAQVAQPSVSWPEQAL